MRREKGFTVIELLVAMTIMALVSTSLVTTVFQTAKTTDGSNNYMTAVQQVQNVGYWIARDAQMAESIMVDNTTPTDWIVMTWIEWDYGGSNSVIHWAIYSVENVVNGIGEIRRNYWTSAGATSQTLVGKYIYYNLGDSVNTSQGSYLYPELNLRLASRFNGVGETRELKVNVRPNLY